jgi:hypothetical protein
MATKVIKFNGKDVPGTVVNFDIIAENWQVYDLADGSTMRMKHTLVEVLRLNSEHNPNGDPIYICQHNTIINTSNIPEHFKIPPSKPPEQK